MIQCVLCDKELKTKRGYYIHLSRTHKVSNSHGRFSLTSVTELFPLLEKKRWKKAETQLNSIDKNKIDDWIHGYIHAIRGMIASLRMPHSVPKPYIIHLKEFSKQKLKELQTGFSSFSKKLIPRNEFDTGYFQAWKDFTGFVIKLRE